MEVVVYVYVRIKSDKKEQGVNKNTYIKRVAWDRTTSGKWKAPTTSNFQCITHILTKDTYHTHA
jgi:hypothetical protein